MASVLRSFVFRRNVHGFLRMGSVTAAQQIWPIRLYSEDRKKFDLAVHMQSMEEKAERYRKISRHDIDKVLEQVKNGQEIKPRAVKQLIECFGNRLIEELPDNRIKLVDTTFKTLLDLPISLDIGHYNSKLKVYCENEHVFSPSEFLAELEQRGIVPNGETFEYFIEFYARTGQTDEINRTMDVMVERGIRLSTRVFNSLILGHGNAGNPKASKKVIERMKQLGITTGTSTRLCLLRAYARQGDIDTILNDLRDLRHEKWPINGADYVEIIYDLAVNGYTEQMEKFLAIIPTTGTFNRAASEVIIRLLNKGNDDAAWKILKKMPLNESLDGKNLDSGNFYIHHLVALNRPLETILTVCEDLEREGLHTKAFKKLIVKLSEIGSIDAALNVLRHVQSRGTKLVEKDFRPIFMATRQPEDVLKILKIMTGEFEVPLLRDTARCHIVGQLNLTNPERTVKDLLDANVSFTVATLSVIFQCIKRNRLKDAADTAIKFNAKINPAFICKELVAALVETRDYENYVKIIRVMYEHYEAIMGSEGTQVSELTSNIFYGRADLCGQILRDSVMVFEPAERISVLKKIASLLLNEGLRISAKEAARLNQIFENELTDEVKEILGKLTSIELKPRPMERIRFTERMGASQYEYIAQKNNITDRSKFDMNILRACHIEGKLSKYEEIFEQLPDDMLTKSRFACLFDLCIRSNELNKAIQVFQQARQKFPDFILNLDFLLDAVSALIEANYLDEALDLISNNGNPNDGDKKDRGQSSDAKSIHVLTQLAETGKESELEQIFESLVKNNYAKVNEKLLTPLVKVYLIANNLPKAIETIKRLAAMYDMIPLRNELIDQFVRTDDQTNLEIILNETTKAYGEYEAVSQLFFAYVKHDQLTKAETLLSKLMNFDVGLIYSMSNALNYESHASVKYVENFLNATHSVARNIDRQAIYMLLLQLYQKISAPQKALDLWQTSQENDEWLCENFRIELAELLAKYGYDVPFVIPERKTAKSAKISTNTRIITPRYERIYTLKKALYNETLDQTWDAYGRLLPRDRLDEKEYNLLMEKLLDAKRLRDATDVLKRAVDQHVSPQISLLQQILADITATADKKLLEEIEDALPPRLVKKIKTAIAAPIRSAENFERICKQFTTAESNSDLTKQFPLNGSESIFKILKTNPELLPNFEQVVEECAKRNVTIPANVLWCHYVSSKNHTASNQIWTKYLQASRAVWYRPISRFAFDTRDPSLIVTLIDFLKSEKHHSKSLKGAYSSLLNIYARNGKVNQAMDLLDDILAKGSLADVKFDDVSLLKRKVEKAGKVFPYQLPEKTKKKSIQSLKK